MHIKVIFVIMLVCVISGLGMIVSGVILNYWKTVNLLSEHDAVWTMVTPLIGLKGNLEMTLASRLSTMVHFRPHKFGSMAFENLIMVQIQAILVGFASGNIGAVSLLLSSSSVTIWITQYIRLCFIGVVTAMVTSFLLGLLTVCIVYTCGRLQMDPDNIASPLVGALGDTVTLVIVQFICQLFSAEGQTYSALIIQAGLLLTALLLIAPLLYAALKPTHSIYHLQASWLPIFMALTLSSGSGFILKQFVFNLKHLPTFQPLVNGVGGNIAAIFCSSQSTKYNGLKVSEQNSESSIEVHGHIMTRYLLVINAAVHGLLLLLLHLCGVAAVSDIMNLHFLLPYFLAIQCQVWLVLFLLQFILPFLWSKGIDPDNAAIPIATGLGDLLGTLLLSAALFTTLVWE